MKAGRPPEANEARQSEARAESKERRGAATLVGRQPKAIRQVRELEVNRDQVFRREVKLERFAGRKSLGKAREADT
jgi:hypothetical protein